MDLSVVKQINGLRLFMMEQYASSTKKAPDYHFTTDMTNQAINWMQAQQSLTPDKPFYVYFATGATHAPHHAPKEYIEKYKGKFDRDGINYVKKHLPVKRSWSHSEGYRT